MTTVLHIASSSNLDTSITRQLGSLIMDGIRTKQTITIIERDLVKQTLPHLSPAFVSARAAGENDASVFALSDQLIDELLTSDVLVIEAPMYNFGIPSVLKAWIDHVCRAGKTFQYSAAGPEGLAKGKKAILIFSRGGVYSAGPMLAMEHQESYLRAVLGFIGITDVESIVVEGLAYGPEAAAASLNAAKELAAGIAQKIA